VEKRKKQNRAETDEKRARARQRAAAAEVASRVVLEHTKEAGGRRDEGEAQAG
jgi:hypothetical protein